MGNYHQAPRDSDPYLSSSTHQYQPIKRKIYFSFHYAFDRVPITVDSPYRQPAAMTLPIARHSLMNLVTQPKYCHDPCFF